MRARSRRANGSRPLADLCCQSANRRADVFARWHGRRAVPVIGSIAGLAFSSAAYGASLFPLSKPWVGGFPSVAFGVSADGSAVVGGSSGGDRALRWTQGGTWNLGNLAGVPSQSLASAASADGSVVVGLSTSASGQEAFRWTEAGGMVGLGDLPGGSFNSVAVGTSADGGVVVGYSEAASGDEAFRWTSSGGMTGLGFLPQGEWSLAQGVSADGLVVVGESDSASTVQAFRWTQAGGMVALGHLPGGSFHSAAYDVSADGLVVVGESLTASGLEAFRWTQPGGMVGLGDLPGGRFWGVAHGTSADGSVVVGQSESASGNEAFIWDAVHGMRSVRDLLTNEYGLDLAGWSLTDATGVSADGRTIVGNGTNPSGGGAWIALLDADAPGVTLRAGDLVIAGWLWGTSWIGAVDPATGTVDRIAPLASAPSGPRDITVGPDQDIYALAGTEIFRIDAESGVSTTVSSGGWLDEAQRLAREPSGSLVVFTRTYLPDPYNPPPGFHWSRVIRIDPTSGTQLVLGEGGFLDHPDSISNEKITDIDVLADGRIMLSRFGAPPYLFMLDPVSGAQSIVFDWSLDNFPGIADRMAVNPRGTHAYRVDQDQCWCTHQVDLITGAVSVPPGFSYASISGPSGFAHNTAVGTDGTAYSFGNNRGAPDVNADYRLSRWNPITQESASFGSDWISAMAVVPFPVCSDGIDNDGDGRTDYGSGGDWTGCSDANDHSEKDTSSHPWKCDDGIDNDGDGLIDHRADGTGDPQCIQPGTGSESPPHGCGLLGIEGLVLVMVIAGLRRVGLADCGLGASRAWMSGE